ncbi:hypothetical protein MKX01_028764 [Papaver californicum]|nr:hypothetical protein MKX01_028764 [Papaver californicum]
MLLLLLTHTPITNLTPIFLSSLYFVLILLTCVLSRSPTSMATGSDNTATAASSLSIIVEKPSSSRLTELGIKSWPKWGCPPGKFPLKFDAEEICYLLKGKVTAYTKGSSECVEFGAGDLVTIPKGLSCTWDVSIAVDKHYKFASS